MKKQKIVLLSFGLLVLLQLWTPAAMIWNRQSVLSNGKAFKFQAAPVDPTDPFRGKYIVLNFLQSNYPIYKNKNWAVGEKIYVQIVKDHQGFAAIHALHKEAPGNGVDFVAATVGQVTRDSAESISIEWPFTRFYMEETKAYAAEQAYRKSLADSSNMTFALVKVKGGEAVLENVFINDKPIVTYLK